MDELTDAEQVIAFVFATIIDFTLDAATNPAMVKAVSNAHLTGPAGILIWLSFPIMDIGGWVGFYYGILKLMGVG